MTYPPTKTGAATVSTDERGLIHWIKTVKQHNKNLYQSPIINCGSFSPGTNTINEKAFTEAKAFVPVTGWDNSNGHKVRTTKSIITNDDLVKKYGENFYQGTNNRGTFSPSTITLLKNADLSTFLHETGHFFLETQFDMAARMTTDQNPTIEQQAILDDTQALLNWCRQP